MEITQEMARKYLESKGLHCPSCGSGNIATYGAVELGCGQNTGRQQAQCNECEGTWWDVYTLTDCESN